MIFDKKGTVSQFYNYRGNTLEFHKFPILIQMGRQTKDECMENIRKALVGTMSPGKALIFNCSRMVPDFENEWSKEDAFPAKNVFTYSTWMDRKEYIKIVKPEENFSLQGHEGQYVMDKDYSICVLFNYENEEKMQKQIACVPDHENYMKFIVE